MPRGNGSAEGFWQRHIGQNAFVKLALFGLLGLVVSWPINHFLGPLPFGLGEVQDPYPSRGGNLEWIHLDLDSGHGMEQVLGMGRIEEGRWNSRAQMKALFCHGSTLRQAILINSLSQASLPDGWLGKEGGPVPAQAMNAVQIIEQMWEELSIPQILDRYHGKQSCQADPSWEEDPSLLDMYWPVETNDQQEWAQARERLRKAAQEAGLGQLVLSPGLGSPDEMEKLGRLLDLAGERIAIATGVGKSGLLGLNGRVYMTVVGRDDQQQYSGMARTDPSGSFIDVMVEDSLGVIVHEWFHSLDLALAPLVLGRAHPGQSWMDQHRRPEFTVSLPSLHRVMNKTLETYGGMEGWHGEQKSHEASRYWSRTAEAMAHAFEWWAYADVEDYPCQMRTQIQGDPKPTLGEASCLAQAWKGVWAQVLEPVLGS